MPSILFISEKNAVVFQHESVSTEILIQRIQMGLWEPPLTAHRGPFHVIQKGEMIIVSPVVTKNDKRRKCLSFTPTETRILYGLALGMGDAQLAISCGLKPRTVRLYVSRLKNRLQALTREHLVAKAAAMGMFDSITEELVS